MPTTTFHLRVWTRYFEPPERLWAARTDLGRLAAEFPAWAPLSLADPGALSAAVAAGGPLESQARVGLLPWPFALTQVEPGVAYQDTSDNALFARWAHTLRVEPTADGARVVDAVTFTPRLPAKPTAILTQRFFVQRHVRAAVGLSADARTVGVSVLRVWDPEEDEAQPA